MGRQQRRGWLSTPGRSGRFARPDPVARCRPVPGTDLTGLDVAADGTVDQWLVETTLGRALFNEALPHDYAFVNESVDKKRLSMIVNDLARRYTKVQVAASLDALKEAGYHWATRSGTTVAVSDVVTPGRKAEILAGYEANATKVQTQFDRGLITDDAAAWFHRDLDEGDERVSKEEMESNFPHDNPIYRMVNSGARGNWFQLRQIAGMRDLMANPRARSSRDRFGRTSERVCPCSSSSSRLTVPERVSPTPRCGPPTPAISPGVSSTCRRTSSSARTTVAPSGA